MSLGYVMSTSVHTVTRPRAAWVPALRAEPDPRFWQELDEADALDAGRDLGGIVGGAVVDDDDLVAVVGGVHRGADPGDLRLEVLGLVVDRQDDRDVERRAAVRGELTVAVCLGLRFWGPFPRS